MSDESDEQAHAIAELVERISPLLSGHTPEVQSGTLADLTSMWLAGMQDLDNPESDAIKELREALLANFIDAVRALIAPNVEMLRERHGLKGGQ